MKKLAMTKLSAAFLAVLILATTLLIPSNGFAQGHGQEKKSWKFVNGHDARDGRWDGRGPRKKWFIANRKYRHHTWHRRWLRRR